MPSPIAVTSPLSLTEAIAGSADDQTTAAPLVASALSWRVCVISREALSGSAIVTAFAGLTVTVQLAEICSGSPLTVVAVIVTSPSLTGVMTPVSGSTVAVSGSSELHVTARSAAGHVEGVTSAVS